ncbi:DUF4142 domain-containing protein [Xylophilus rhododendri]|uniref:DUF4142 domain-containing protein n=1 Tax=Xylophilus rhododendri TaxID=2697032 RepID=A0A857IZ08_9BURK|nr:DUF4142 domain-containing protein [Xylophilus rhododendri]QHI96830.1 DUF4142 domain-containing protein [Xylophilus rhododendri]
MKTFRLALIPALAIGLAGMAHADGAFNLTDKKLATDIANGGVYEVQAAQVAAKRAQKGSVRSYAEMLVNDHKKANAEFEKLAASKSMDLPRELPHEQRGRVQGLERHDAAGFDQDFLQKVGLDDHAKDIELFEKTAETATDPELKAFAKTTLPTLKHHRAEAEKLMATVKK